MHEATANGTGHRHYHLAGIKKRIGQSALSDAAKARAMALFDRLAEAEASIHGMPVEKVHLHEVGALDSVVDIVGCVFALEWSDPPFSAGHWIPEMVALAGGVPLVGSIAAGGEA